MAGGCILGEIGAFGPRRPWLASPAMRLLGPHAPISPRMHPKRALSLKYKFIDAVPSSGGVFQCYNYVSNFLWSGWF